MNKYQRITLVVVLLNLVLIGLFPPYDYVPAARGYASSFDGFYWIFAEHGQRLVNSGFLQMEVLVVCFNAAIAWLLLSDRRQSKRGVDWQRVVLFGVALNLVLVLLFPPMQNVVAITRATLPSFEGFYFVFGEHGMRAIVTPILYLEVIFVLVNGALLYLLFNKARSVELSQAQRAALVEELKRASSRR